MVNQRSKWSIFQFANSELSLLFNWYFCWLTSTWSYGKPCFIPAGGRPGIGSRLCRAGAAGLCPQRCLGMCVHGATAEDGRGGAHWRINSVVDGTFPAKMGILREQRNIRSSGTNIWWATGWWLWMSLPGHLHGPIYGLCLGDLDMIIQWSDPGTGTMPRGPAFGPNLSLSLWGMMEFIQHQEIPSKLLRFCCKPWLAMLNHEMDWNV